MSQWVERFRNHQIWQVLKDMGPAIDQALSRDGLEAPTTEGLSRLRFVLAFVGKRLAGADSHLFQAGPLDSISDLLRSATNEVQAFTSNGNTGHITNANTHADSALSYFATLNVPITTEDFVAAKEAAESYRRGLDTILNSAQLISSQVRAEMESLRARLSELTNEVNSERQRLSALASDHQSQFSNAQETRSREWSDAVKDRQERFIALMSDYTQQLTDQATEFERLKDSIEKQHTVSLEEMKKQFVDSANKLKDEILDRKKEVEKLVGVIGNLGVTSGYQKAATEARRATLVWQIITVLSMLGFIAIAYYKILPLLTGEFTWGSFAGRVFVSLTAGVLAAYSANQADKYQKIEHRNRKLALELEAIGPFLAPLPQEKQEEFRLLIGGRSFGQNDGGDNIGEPSPATLIDLLKSKEMKETIAEIIKASKL